VPCGVGTYATTAMQAWNRCTPCPNGTTTNGTSVVGQSLCVVCNGGYSAVNGSAPCLACRVGTAVASGLLAWNRCAPCANGTTTSGKTGQSTCAGCVDGQSVVDGVSLCQACPVATFANNVAVAVAWNRCTACPPLLKATATGSGRCVACAPGTYWVGASLECVACDAGTAVNAAGTGCDLCLAGTYAPPQSPTCMPCPINTSNTLTGVSACAPCSNLQTSAGGLALCEYKVVGRFLALCPPDFFCG
jgi:hypothetical protein